MPSITKSSGELGIDSPRAVPGAVSQVVLKRGDELYAERRFGVRTTDRGLIAQLAAEEAARIFGAPGSATPSSTTAQKAA